MFINFAAELGEIVHKEHMSTLADKKRTPFKRDAFLTSLRRRFHVTGGQASNTKRQGKEESKPKRGLKRNETKPVTAENMQAFLDKCKAKPKHKKKEKPAPSPVQESASDVDASVPCPLPPSAGNDASAEIEQETKSKDSHAKDDGDSSVVCLEQASGNEEADGGQADGENVEDDPADELPDGQNAGGEPTVEAVDDEKPADELADEQATDDLPADTDQEDATPAETSAEEADETVTEQPDTEQTRADLNPAELEDPPAAEVDHAKEVGEGESVSDPCPTEKEDGRSEEDLVDTSGETDVVPDIPSPQVTDDVQKLEVM